MSTVIKKKPSSIPWIFLFKTIWVFICLAHAECSPIYESRCFYRNTCLLYPNTIGLTNTQSRTRYVNPRYISKVAAMCEKTENGESFMEKKSGITFDFLNLDNSDTLTVKTLMTFPVELIKKDRVYLGVQLAVTYKNYFQRICQAAGLETGATSIGRKDWISGALLVHKTDWYAQEFMPTVVDVYFRSLDVGNCQGVTFAEWKKLYSQRGITDEEFCKSTFRRMDKNGDGRISKSEFKYAFLQYGLGEDPEVDFSFLYAKK